MYAHMLLGEKKVDTLSTLIFKGLKLIRVVFEVLP